MPEKRPGMILEAALKIFSQKGYQAATMEEVARAAGITKGTVYLYFPSKLELFIATIRAQLQEVIDLLPTISYEVGQDPEILTKNLGKRFLDVLMTPKVAQALPLAIGEYPRLPVLKTLYFEEVLSKADVHVAKLIEFGKSLGMVRDVNSDVAARCLLGSFFVMVLTQEVFSAKELTSIGKEEIARTIATIYFRGLLRPEASS